MSVILEFDKMPQNCEKCRMLLKVSKLCAYCMATGFQIKYDETDLRDGMCPLVEESDNSENYVHGHWIEDDEAVYCSVCRSAYPRGERISEWINQSNYCYNCGAKMDRKESGDDKLP